MWVTLGEYLDVRDGTHDTPKYVSSGIPLVTSKNLNNGTLDFSNIKFISEQDHQQISLRSKVDIDDILFAMIGSIGNPVLIKDNYNFSIKNVGLFKKNIKETNMEYIYYILLILQDDMKKRSSGGVQSFVSLSFLRNYLIPLPPSNEQKRIVTKLEEILPFIDEYDKKEQKLTALNQQFPEQLKKSILQAAIQGKLVEQDPNDEPASELIKRIQAEKERLISEKKIKKPKVKSEIILRDNLPYEIVDGVERCIADEVPFEIPERWVWVRLGNITNILMGSSPTGESLNGYGNGIEFHQGKSFFTEKFIGYSNKYTTSEITLSNDKDLLLSVRAPVGDININNRLLCIGRGISAITPLDKMETIFLFYWLMSFKLDFIKKSTGSTFKAISSDSINNQLIPIPPLNEQKRIVKKIEELFSYIKHI